MLAGNLHVQVLGPIDIIGPDGSLPLGGRKQRLLLADLLVARAPVSSDRLVFDLWGDDPPPTAAGTLAAYVSRLRSALGPGSIVKDNAGYRLTTEHLTIDADKFEANVYEADRLATTDPAGAITELRIALARWRGRPFGEIGDEPFALSTARRLQEQRDLAVEQLLTLELELGKHVELVPELHAAVEEQPLRERRWQLLMLALYRSGRQADALRTFRRAARTLGEQLGIEPGPQLTSLEQRILLQDPGLAYRVADADRREASVHPTNLREVTTTFIGRTDLIAQTSAALRTHRVTTLVGPGGVGKTRLAVEVGWDLLHLFPGGVWDVDLAVVDRDEAVPTQIGAAIGASLDRSTTADLIDAIGQQATMLVLDNCEHVLAGAVATVDALTGACPNLRILATSRSALGVGDEAVVNVSPLPAPSNHVTDPSVIATFDAVALFEARGSTVHEGFRVTAVNAGAIAEVVRSLDGIPLAIELAAGQLALLTPGQLAEQVAAETFPRLIGDATADARHATLRAAIDWSYELLDHPSRELLARLSVFADHFSIEEAAAVASLDDASADDIERIVRSLADRSLLTGPNTAWADGAERWGFLETTQRYARERLDASPEASELRRRHTTWVARLVADVRAHQHGPDQAVWYRRLRARRHEVDQAVLRAESDPGLLTELHLGLWHWWYLEERPHEAAAQLERYRSPSPDRPAEAELAAARLLVTAGVEGYGSEFDDDVARVVAVADHLEPADRAMVQLLVGDALTVTGRYADAHTALTAAAQVFGDAGISWAEGWALLRLVRVPAFGSADFATADRYLERAAEVLDRSGDVQLIAYSRLALANRSRMISDFSRGLELAEAAYTAFTELGLPAVRLESLWFVALCSIGLARYDDAGRRTREMRDLAEEVRSDSWREASELAGAINDLARGRREQAVATLRRLDESASGSIADAVLTGLAEATALVEPERASDLLPRLEALASSRPSAFAAPSWLAVGRVRATTGDLDGALDAYRRAADGFLVLPTPHGLASAAQGAAGCLLGSELDRAVALLGAVGRIRDECGAVPAAHEIAEAERLNTAAGAARGATAFNREWTAAYDAAVDLGWVRQLLTS